jgi:hypothetical protein
LENWRSLIAVLLLLLFVRAMVPDAVILAFHQHEHIIDDPGDDAKLDVSHHHCHVDDLYNVDYTAPAFSIQLQLTPVEVCYMQLYSFVWKFTYPNNTYLRGPPLA